MQGEKADKRHATKTADRLDSPKEWEARKGCRDITRMKYGVSASLVTPGQSLKERVNAADGIHRSGIAFG
jgi:hypothetical protein